MAVSGARVDPHSPVVDLLRLADSERGRLVAWMEQRASADSARSKRVARRFDASGQRWILQFAEGAQSGQKFLVLPVDLSEQGVCVLHGAFVYVRTPCVISLRSLDGEAVSLTGRVTRCEHVGGRAHEIGIRLDHRIDAAMFVRSAEPFSSGDEPWITLRHSVETMMKLVSSSRDVVQVRTAMTRVQHDLGAIESGPRSI